MKCAVYRVPGRTNEPYLVAMADGLRRHGWEAAFFADLPDRGVEFVVVWSWRVGLRVRPHFNGPILVLERGYIGNRTDWTSVGWDGLNGRARFTLVSDPRRFDALHANLLQPWRRGGGYALIAGQVVGDTALIGTDILKWYRETGVALWKAGWDVKFRQHPVEVDRGVQPPHVSFAERITSDMATALAGAGLVVTYNSNFATDAVLAGVPVYAADRGSIVYDLASQDFEARRPDRSARLHEMAWCQWSVDELRNGDAWNVAKETMHG